MHYWFSGDEILGEGESEGLSVGSQLAPPAVASAKVGLQAQIHTPGLVN